MEKPAWPGFLSKMYKSDRYKDLVLKCQGREFKISGVIACSQSPVIDRAISSSSGFKESKTKVFAITKGNADAVGHMVQFMYTGDYDARLESGTRFDKTALLCHADVNELADYLQVPELNQLATDKVTELLEKHWSADLFFDIAERVSDNMRCQVLLCALGMLAAAHLRELFKDERFSKLGIVNSFASSALQECAAGIGERKGAKWKWN